REDKSAVEEGDVEGRIGVPRKWIARERPNATRSPEVNPQMIQNSTSLRQSRTAVRCPKGGGDIYLDVECSDRSARIFVGKSQHLPAWMLSERTWNCL